MADSSNIRLFTKYGEIPEMEMYEIFNMGIGMVLAVQESKVKRNSTRN